MPPKREKPSLGAETFKKFKFEEEGEPESRLTFHQATRGWTKERLERLKQVKSERAEQLNQTIRALKSCEATTEREIQARESERKQIAQDIYSIVDSDEPTNEKIYQLRQLATRLDI